MSLAENFFDKNKESEIEPLSNFLNIDTKIQLDVMREDKTHPFVSGNKFRKLKYNFHEIAKQGVKTIITFGGAYSNHIAAVAAAAKECNIISIGFIRGEELHSKIPTNATISFAKDCGMVLNFISREQYALKNTDLFRRNLTSQFGDAYFLPEGGTNELAILGCAEIVSDRTQNYDYICLPVGTGGTLAGIVSAASEGQKVVGYSALKGTFQTSEVKKYTSKTNFKIIDDYCFGGYAKIDSELIRFINTFKEKTGIPLDPIYTGKMFFGILEGIKRGEFNTNSRILAIHTGGLQGIAGMNEVLKRKKLPQIE